MRKPLITGFLLLCVVCLVAAGVAWYLLNDEAFLKRTLHDQVLKRTGRDLRIDGPLKLTLGSASTLDARQVHFSGADWDPEPDMASAGRLRLTVDFRSLFSDHTLVRAFELSDCRFVFRTNAEGVSNWDGLRGPAAEKEAAGSDPPGPPMRIEHLHIDTCRFSHDAPGRDQPVELSVSKVSLDLMEQGGYEGEATGSIGEYPLSFSGHFGPVRSWWEGGPFSFQMSLQAGRIALHGSGSLADTRSISGANLDMQFSGPEFAEVTELLALPLFSSGAFDFSLTLESAADMTTIDLDGDLGSFDITSEGQLDRLVGPHGGHLVLSASGPDLQALGDLLRYPGLVPDAFDLKVKMGFDRGVLTLDPFQLETAHDSLKVSGVAGALPELRDSSLEFIARTDEIGRWKTLLGRPGLKGGALSASGNLETDGAGVVTLKADAEVLESHLHVAGTIGKATGPFVPEVDFTFDTARLDRLSALADIRNLPAAAARASGHVARRDTGFRLDKVAVQLGATHALIDGLVVPEKRFAGSDFTLQLDTPSLSSLGQLWGWPNLPDVPLALNGAVRPLGRGFAFESSDAKLGGIQLSFRGRMADVDSPAQIDADVDVHMDSLRQLAFLPGETRWLDLPLTARGGVRFAQDSLSLDGVHVTLGQSVADLDGVIALADGFKGSMLDIRGSGKDLGELFPGWNLAALPRDYAVAGKGTQLAGATSLKDVRLQWGDTVVELAGSTDRLWPPGQVDLAVRFDMPDASVYNQPFDWTLPARPVSASAHVSGTPAKLRVEGLSALVGDSTSTSELEVAWASPPRVSGTIDADIVDLSYWLRPEARSADPGPGGASSSDKRFFDDQPVRGLGSKLVELDLEVEADQANFGNGVIEDFRAGFHYTDTAFRLDRVEAHDRTGQKVAGSFLLDTSGAIPRVELRVNGSGLRLGLASVKGQDPATVPPTELELDLSGSGATRHDLASSLNGTLRIFQGPGKVAASGMQLLLGDFFSQLFDLLNPFSKADQFDEMDCSVFAADIVSGIANFDPIVVQLKEVTILSKGTINLETERLDLAFNTFARKGIGINAGLLINPFIKVGGTLAAPAMELDPARAVIKGGAMVATAGIPMLAKSFSERFLNKDPCAEARAKLEQKGEPAR